MKVCVIGNSHIAALKHGWEAIRTGYPDRTLTFFGARGGAMKGLVADGKQLVGSTAVLKRGMAFTSGLSAIVPDDYDVILVHGIGTRPYFKPAGTFYSEQSLKAALDEHTRGKVSTHVFTQLRQVTQQRVYFGHQPFKAARRVRHRQPPTDYIEGLFIANEIYYGPRNAVLVPQPVETIANGRATDPEFSAGSRRLSVGASNDDEQHPDRDRRHMNERFGASWMRAFFDALPG
jgi:hypothetical protein